MLLRRWLHYGYQCLFLITIAGCSTGEKIEITLNQFERLNKGMTYEEVVQVFGVEGEQVSESHISSVPMTIYIWKGADITDQVTLVFQNNKSINKQQMGLDREDDPSME